MRRLYSHLLLAGLLGGAAGCGSSENSGTYVRLTFTSSVTFARPVKSIAVDLLLGGRTSAATFPAPAGRDITFSTTSVLEIQSGDGPLSVTARALDANQALLAIGSGTVIVERDKTVDLTIDFGGIVPDAGIDGPTGIDGRGIDGAIDSGMDITLDRPLDAPFGRDGPTLFDTADAVETSDGSLDRGLDRPGSGGTIGTGGAMDAGSRGGAGGGTGGSAGGSTGSPGTGGNTVPDAPPAVFILTANPLSLDFGVILPGNMSAPQTFTIINRGDVPTPPLTTSISNPSAFPLSSDTCNNLVLGPGATCTVTFVFTPGGSGFIQAEGKVGPADGSGPRFQLSGTGAGGPAMLSLSPPQVTLPPIDVNTSTAVAFTVTNGGDLEAGSITIQVPGSPVFQLTANGCGTGTLGPRSQCAFTVTFAPTVFGPASATITVQSSLGLSASATIAGTGRDYMPLTINFAGTGGGTVAGGPQPCPAGTPCTFSIPRLDPSNIPQLVLTATPNGVSFFDGWSGACTGTGSCTVVMDQARAVTAGFTRGVTLNLTVLGLAGHTGALMGDQNVECTGSCSYLLRPSDAFILSAKPASMASTFAAWTSGPCKGTGTKCTFTMTSTVSITATFGPQSYMFVTSRTVVPGKLGSLVAADELCTSAAVNYKLPGTYRAWLSSSVESAYARVGKGGWIRTDGRPFAPDAKMLHDPAYLTVYYPPRLDEAGNDLGNARIPVATASAPDGSAVPGTNTFCKNYVSTDGSLQVGDAASGSSRWSSRIEDATGCAAALHLYCFRTDLGPGTIAPAKQEGRRVFVTSRPFVVGSGAPNELCWKEADAARLEPKAFVAFLATTDIAAAQLVDPRGLPWKRLDEVFVVQDGADIANRLLAPVDALADGIHYLPANVWTGAADPRSKGTATCGDWGVNGFSGQGIVGDDSTSAALDWFNSAAIPCKDETTHLMCVEK